MAGGPLAIGDDVELLRERSRPTLALYYGGMGARGSNYYNNILRRYGFEAEADEIQNLYLDGKRDEAAALVPQQLVDRDVARRRRRVREGPHAAYREAGVTVLNVEPIGPNGVRDIETLAEWLA